MSLLFPKINSADPEEAKRAFRPGTMNDDKIDSLLKRDDIVIKGYIFEYVERFRPALLERIKNDPSHPFSRRAAGADEEKAKEAERKRSFELSSIIRKDQKGEKFGLMDEIASFSSRYHDLTDEEKCLLGEIVYRTLWSGNTIVYRDTKLAGLKREMRPFFCRELAKKHLTDWPEVFPKELTEEVLEGSGLSDTEKKEIYLRYRIAHPPLVSPCEVGEHSWEKIGTETDDNHEDYDHPVTYTVYRCRVCGEEMRSSQERTLKN